MWAIALRPPSWSGSLGGAGCIAETPPGNCANAPSLHLLESGYDIRTVRELLGRKDVKTTMIYTHVLTRGPAAVRSPADALLAETDDTPVPSAAAAPLGRYPATARRLTLPGAGDD